jgi:hypothetical protein
MKTLFGTLLLVLAAQASAQGIEADLDGNASALQASEMRPAPKKGSGPFFQKRGQDSRQGDRTNAVQTSSIRSRGS